MAPVCARAPIALALLVVGSRAAQGGGVPELDVGYKRVVGQTCAQAGFSDVSPSECFGRSLEAIGLADGDISSKRIMTNDDYADPTFSMPRGCFLQQGTVHVDVHFKPDAQPSGSEHFASADFVCATRARPTSTTTQLPTHTTMEQPTYTTAPPTHAAKPQPVPGMLI